jgi:hypothetical protein
VPSYISLYDKYEIKEMKKNYTSYISSYYDQNDDQTDGMNNDEKEKQKVVGKNSKNNNQDKNLKVTKNDNKNLNKNININKNKNENTEIIENSFNINITESPYWPERAFHIHTQHPLELTDVLQGHDIPQSGMHGPQCGIFSSSKKKKYYEKNKRNIDSDNDNENSENGVNGRNGENVYRNYNNENGQKSNSRHRGGEKNVNNNNNNNNNNNDYRYEYEEEGEREREGGEGEGGEGVINDDELTKRINDKKTIKLNLKIAREILENKISYCERWDDMVGDVSSMFEWAVANRLNKIEWLLLGNYKWGDELETRMKR